MLAELSYGSASKLNVQWGKRFWVSDYNWNGEAYTSTKFYNPAPNADAEQSIFDTWEVTRGQAGDAGVLLQYLAGDFARTPEHRVSGN